VRILSGRSPVLIIEDGGFISTAVNVTVHDGSTDKGQGGAWEHRPHHPEQREPWLWTVVAVVLEGHGVWIRDQIRELSSDVRRRRSNLRW